ncbi:hypothetical protein CR513_12001, partial [Mucuna pruriens]
MSVGLGNALSIFQRCMINIFLDLLEDYMEVFMDDFTVFTGDSSRISIRLPCLCPSCYRRTLTSSLISLVWISRAKEKTQVCANPPSTKLGTPV